MEQSSSAEYPRASLLKMTPWSPWGCKSTYMSSASPPAI
jgi:hypothetical protein